MNVALAASSRVDFNNVFLLTSFSHDVPCVMLCIVGFFVGNWDEEDNEEVGRGILLAQKWGIFLYSKEKLTVSFVVLAG